MTNNDFESVLKNAVITKKERIVYDYTIKIGDDVFDLDDLIETIEETMSMSDIVWTDKKMIDAMKKIGVLEHEGNSKWYVTAELGANGKSFLEFLKKERYKDE
jgi:hypothetical protein